MFKLDLKSIIQIAVVILLLVFMWDSCQQRKERKIYEQNTTNMLKDQAREIILTKKELKEALDSRTKEIMDSMGFKTKQIDHYVQAHYTFKDSLLMHTVTSYDTLHDRYNFIASKGCWTIGGFVKPKLDSIVITKQELNDTLDIFQYHDWDKKYLWGLIKCKRYDVAGVYSRCKQDTIKVIKNYKIRR